MRFARPGLRIRRHSRSRLVRPRRHIPEIFNRAKREIAVASIRLSLASNYSLEPNLVAGRLPKAATRAGAAWIALTNTLPACGTHQRHEHAEHKGRLVPEDDADLLVLTLSLS